MVQKHTAQEITAVRQAMNPEFADHFITYVLSGEMILVSGVPTWTEKGLAAVAKRSQDYIDAQSRRFDC